MAEIIDLIFNQYLRIFVGFVLAGLVIFSLYCSHNDSLKRLLKFKTYNNKIKKIMQKKNIPPWKRKTIPLIFKKNKFFNILV